MTSQWSGQLQPEYHNHWWYSAAPPKTAPGIQLDWICFSGRLWPTQKEKPWTKLDYCLICTFILMTASLLILLFLLGFFTILRYRQKNSNMFLNKHSFDNVMHWIQCSRCFGFILYAWHVFCHNMLAVHYLLNGKNCFTCLHSHCFVTNSS